MKDECDEMTREQLIKRFASDWGFGPNVTEQFTTDVLRKACKSSSPYLHMKALIYFIMKNLIEVEEEKDKV